MIIADPRPNFSVEKHYASSFTNGCWKPYNDPREITAWEGEELKLCIQATSNKVMKADTLDFSFFWSCGLVDKVTTVRDRRKDSVEVISDASTTTVQNIIPGTMIQIYGSIIAGPGTTPPVATQAAPVAGAAGIPAVIPALAPVAPGPVVPPPIVPPIVPPVIPPPPPPVLATPAAPIVAQPGGAGTAVTVDLAAAVPGAVWIQFIWTDPVTGVQRHGPNHPVGAPAPILTLDVPADLAVGTTYEFVVVALDATGSTTSPVTGYTVT